MFSADPSFARELDRNDPLGPFRERFHIPSNADGTPKTYLLGNSLGLQPRATRVWIDRVLADWAAHGVDAHMHGESPWIGYARPVEQESARIVGADPEEVAVMNSLTVNLHLMLVSFYRPNSGRCKIVMETRAFPSDRYAIVSHLRYRGLEPEQALVELGPRAGEDTLRAEDIEEYIAREGDRIALVLLGGINYYTGQAFDMERITRAAHSKGCMVGFDLAHAAGNIPLRLHGWDVDFAVWCSYKYLNGGPGALSGCFVHGRHGRDATLARLAGWWGVDMSTRFLMEPVFVPAPGAAGWHISNPPVMELAALRASLELFAEAGMEALRKKSLALTGYLEYLLEQIPGKRFTVITPADPCMRGAQLSIRMGREGKRYFDQLSAQGVACDWREPDVIRVAPVPFYNTYADVRDFVTKFNAVLGSR